MAGYMPYIVQPAPALLDIALGHIDLIETLSAALVVHQGPIRFSKRASRQHNLGPGRGVMVQVVDDNDVLGGLEGCVHDSTLGPPVEVILQDDDGVCGTVF